MVVNELQKQDYPVDECLKICKSYKIALGVAYLMDKRGFYLDAINLYFDIFMSQLKSLIQNETIQLISTKDLISLIQKKVSPCIQICREHNKRGEEDSENNWFLVILRMTKLRKEFYYLNKEILLSLNFVYSSILTEVLNQVQLNSILMNLEGIIGFFSLEEVKQTFSQLLSGYCYERDILSQTLVMVRQDAASFEQYYYNSVKLGIRMTMECWNGDLDETRTKLMVNLKCGHVYHKECNVVQYELAICQYCLMDPDYQLQLSLILGQLKVSIQKQKRNNQEVALPTIVHQDADDILQQSLIAKKEKRLEQINKWKIYEIQKEQFWVDLDTL